MLNTQQAVATIRVHCARCVEYRIRYAHCLCRYMPDWPGWPLLGAALLS